MTRPASLAARLFASAAFWSLSILLVAGLALSAAVRRSAERGFDERLGVYVKEIVGDLAGGPAPRLPGGDNFGEPRFELPFSGWYWQVVRLDAPEGPGPHGAGSGSLLGAALPEPEGDGPARRGGYVTGADGRVLRAVARDIDLGEAGGRYRITVAAEADEIGEEVGRFDRLLAATLGALALALTATAALQVRFGLKPLADLRGAVARVRRGEALRVEGDYPAEIAPLAAEINLLTEANRAVVERARARAGDLAHGLKTPLSVLLNEARAAPGPLAEALRAGVEAMRTQVDHHLDRARAAASAATPGEATPLAPAVEALLRAHRKIHADRAVAFTASVPPGLRFRGAAQDLDELLGNLIDNAGKWAASRVEVAAAGAPPGPDGTPRLTLRVDDDGPGMPEAARARGPRRGHRLDETVPGSGLGLSIVADLAALYDGGLCLSASPLGGLRAELDLPATEGAG